MTFDDHQRYRKNLTKLTECVDDKVTMVAVPDFEGCLTFMQKIKMPMFMTNRIIPNVFYLREHGDEKLEFVNSSQGTDNLVRQQAKLIGKDVVGNTIINYQLIKKVDGGCTYQSVLCIDICGSIPDYLKRQGADLYVKGQETTVYTIAYGKAPKK